MSTIPQTYEEFQQRVDAEARSILCLLAHVDSQGYVDIIDWLPENLVALTRAFGRAERAHFEQMTAERERMREQIFGPVDFNTTRPQTSSKES